MKKKKGVKVTNRESTHLDTRQQNVFPQSTSRFTIIEFITTFKRLQ